MSGAITFRDLVDAMNYGQAMATKEFCNSASTSIDLKWRPKSGIDNHRHVVYRGGVSCSSSTACASGDATQNKQFSQCIHPDLDITCEDAEHLGNTTCSGDSGRCGFTNLATDVTCVATSSSACAAVTGPLPYDLDTAGAPFKDLTKQTKPFTEYYSHDGSCDTNKRCDRDADCTGGNVCLADPNQEKGDSDSKRGKCVAPKGGALCLTNTCDQTKAKCKCNDTGDCMGSFVCHNGLCQPPDGDAEAGACVASNFLLKRWCEEPSSRCESDPSKSGCPEAYRNPAFVFRNGSCLFTEDYCNHFRGKLQKFDNDGNLEDATDCFEDSADGFCIDGKITNRASQCTPNDGFMQSTLIKTMGLWWDQLMQGRLPDFKDCSGARSRAADTARARQMPQSSGKVFEGFRDELMAKRGRPAQSLCDSRYVAQTRMISANFVPGLDLVLIQWKPQAHRQPSLGVTQEQVSAKYPQLLVKRSQAWYIRVTVEDVKQDKRLKRLYNVISTGTSSAKLAASLVGHQIRSKRAKYDAA